MHKRTYLCHFIKGRKDTVSSVGTTFAAGTLVPLLLLFFFAFKKQRLKVLQPRQLRFLYLLLA
jgi:nitric oxide reductase large subunit